MSYTAQSLEFVETRIVLAEQPKGTVKESVTGYNFIFTNNDVQETKFVDLKTLFDYTNEIMNGGSLASCETKIQDALERLYGADKDNAPVDFFFFRFADDILEDYWDDIENELINS